VGGERFDTSSAIAFRAATACSREGTVTVVVTVEVGGGGGVPPAASAGARAAAVSARTAAMLLTPSPAAAATAAFLEEDEESRGGGRAVVGESPAPSCCGTGGAGGASEGRGSNASAAFSASGDEATPACSDSGEGVLGEEDGCANSERTVGINEDTHGNGCKRQRRKHERYREREIDGQSDRPWRRVSRALRSAHSHQTLDSRICRTFRRMKSCTV
jgi:hypothetical protein